MFISEAFSQGFRCFILRICVCLVQIIVAGIRRVEQFKLITVDIKHFFFN